MIRFINLDDQINEGQKQFAFFDTVIDQFVKINSEMRWESKEDLIATFNLEAFPERYSEMIRLFDLIPNDWNNNNDNIIGYKLSGVVDRKTVDAILGTPMPYYGDILLSGISKCATQMTEEEKAVYFTTGHVGGSLVEKMRELKVLDLWFEPIYKK